MKFPFAKKSLGQNFLTSTKAIEDILVASEVKEGDVVLEIGPGRGVLTKELLKRGAIVVAVEKDEALVSILNEMFKDEVVKGQLKLIEGDILDCDQSSLIDQKYKLIANIPYYITGQIFRMFLEGPHYNVDHCNAQPISMTLLVQKEVAERVTSRDKKESILSLSVKAYGEVRVVSIVKRGSFTPSPNVDSAILHISHISKKFFENNAISEKTFFEILKAAFSHKRKIILKNLEDKGFSIPESINTKARAEDLTLEDFALLTKANSTVT